MGRRKMDSELHRIKLETGTVYQTSKGGNYYFRYQINGERKCVSLKTANQEEAIRKARELLPIVQAGDPQSAGTASDRPGNQSGGDRHPRENRPQDGRANPFPARIEDLGNLRQSSESGASRHSSGTALLRGDAGRVPPFSRSKNQDVFANHGSACDQICRTSAAYADLRLHAQPEDRPSAEDLRHAAGVSGGW